MKLHEQIPDQLPTADPASQRNTRMGRNMVNFSGGPKIAVIGCLIFFALVLWGWWLSEQGYTSENLEERRAQESQAVEEPVKY